MSAGPLAPHLLPASKPRTLASCGDKRFLRVAAVRQNAGHRAKKLTNNLTTNECRTTRPSLIASFKTPHSGELRLQKVSPRSRSSPERGPSGEEVGRLPGISQLVAAAPFSAAAARHPDCSASSDLFSNRVNAATCCSICLNCWRMSGNFRIAIAMRNCS
jgi:hypothetical protein